MPPARHVTELLAGLPCAALAGCDEVGRGALAGPVVAAAVIFPAGLRKLPGLRDSKQLKAAERRRLAASIRRHAQAWAIGEASVAEIEQLNIHHASLLAMRRALEGLPPAFRPPSAIAVDGLHLPPLAWDIPGRAYVDGDALLPCIMAAAVLAKVERDGQLAQLGGEYPHYGFATNAGYGTPGHLEALERHGACPHHRRTYEPVARLGYGLFAAGEAESPGCAGVNAPAGVQ
jgi:ribonuclease HII